MLENVYLFKVGVVLAKAIDEICDTLLTTLPPYHVVKKCVRAIQNSKRKQAKKTSSLDRLQIASIITENAEVTH
jgi:hypothetical protein